jgi:hypothetical protein
MTIRRLELYHMDAAAFVHRTALLHALPIFEGLHTPEEDRWYFRERVFPVCEVFGAFDDSTLVGIIAFHRDWISCWVAQSESTTRIVIRSLLTNGLQ